MNTATARRGGPTAGALAYTVDDQGRVLSVRAAMPLDPATARTDAPPPVALRTLVAPLTWEPVQRLLAWGAREGMTAAELLDSCRAATHQTTMTTRRRRSAR
jgi:hypothetical protein